MSRPSASVLITSMVLPRWLLITSPGFTAVPDGRFSVDGIRPITLIFGFRRPSVSNVPRTAAALHLQVAREAVARRDAVPELLAGGNLGGLLGVTHDGHLLQVGFGIVRGGLELGERPRALPRALHDHLTEVLRREAVACLGGDRERELRRAERACALRRHRRGAPDARARHLAALPDAHQQDALGLAVARVEQQRVVPLPLEVSARDGAGQPSAGCAVELGERGG